ncbi:MAG TPA: hypothetical protein VJR89_32155 [Polyangiales bacterium]|nr:hypothetical protein [Polyangiales bacterium]
METDLIAEFSPETLAAARGRLGDRGIDPRHVVATDPRGRDIDLATLYLVLGSVAATEKAGQLPIYALARLALHAGLPNEIADTLFLAYNQQSAEEAGHGDKVFGNAYFALGATPATGDLSVVGDPSDAGSFLAPEADPKQNKQRLGTFAAAIGGIETVALQRTFPTLVKLFERWDHPVSRDLLQQISEIVRPEEARHVLLFRYVFHQLIAPKGEAVITRFHETFNGGRAQVGAATVDRQEFDRLVGSSCPTPRQLLGKERALPT